jgi:hypothetical protein
LHPIAPASTESDLAPTNTRTHIVNTHVASENAQKKQNEEADAGAERRTQDEDNDEDANDAE